MVHVCISWVVWLTIWGRSMKLCKSTLAILFHSLAVDCPCSTYLREALRISTLKGMLMPGEHLRSLFKLAQVLRKRSETIVEASDLELELIRLNGMRKLSLQSTKSSEMGSGICTPAYTASVSENDNRRQEEEEESSYDDLVGTLWR